MQLSVKREKTEKISHAFLLMHCAKQSFAASPALCAPQKYCVFFHFLNWLYIWYLFFCVRLIILWRIFWSSITTTLLIMGSVNRDNPALVGSGGRLEEDQSVGPIPHADPDLSTKQLSLAFLRPMDSRLRLVTSTCCAGYDDGAQICCEHGGEGGQNVSLSIMLFF